MALGRKFICCLGRFKQEQFVANPFRSLPSVSQLLESPPLKRLSETLNQQVVVDSVREFLDGVRDRMGKASESIEVPSPTELANRIAAWFHSERRDLLVPVINGTGVLLHTGLGRAPLAPSAIQRIQEIASGYSSLELDLHSGERGQRAKIVERILRELTGCEAAAVANNNAAATMLALSSVAAGKEVIVSRGQLIEIGGSYRLPEVMECAGCKLREVGTTNKTRLADYEQAINENTGAILRVHPSNFQVVGFTETPALVELVELAHRHELPLIDDVGSGALIDFAEIGLLDEPVVGESIKKGADLVLFSGDKLVGGPQSGIAIGKKVYIERILKNPLMRAMRVDKLTLAGLQTTLGLYHKREDALREIPILNMLTTPLANLQFRANKFIGQIQYLTGIKSAEAVQEQSMLGGGSLPTQRISTWCVSIQPSTLTLDQFSQKLREHDPAVMGRISQGRFLLDFRTIPPRLDAALAGAFETLFVS
jgi:L-seryl-tRNA(Ser) seleniumtransferase